MDFNELKKFARSALGQVNKGDIVAVYSRSNPVHFEMDNLKSVEDNERFAVGLRVFENGRVGNSYVNSLDDANALVENALQSASLGDEIDFDLPGDAEYSKMKTYFDETADYSKEEAIELGQMTVKRLKEIDERIKIDVGINKTISESLILNSSGFCGESRETHLSAFASLVLVEENGSLLMVGDSDSNFSPDLEWDDVLSRIEWRYKHALEKSTIDTGYYPVIFAPDSIDLFLNSLEIAGSGRSLFKGISPMEGKIGEKIAVDGFSMVDDPTVPGALGSYGFDDEGVIPVRTPIIEDGVFKNFIFDLATAKRMGTKSTGHGSRGVSSLPAPSYSNLFFSKGSVSFEDMVKSIDRGLLIFETLGAGMSNVIAGDFSVNVELGYLIEKGEVKGRVKDVMISANVYEMLNKISLMENQLHKLGSVYAPHILVDQVSVSS